MNSNRIEHWTDRLSEYLDGELARGERDACDAHLAACAECSAVLEELRVVAARAGALPQLPPERDLWPAIEPRLKGRLLGLPSAGRWAGRFSQRFSLSGAQLVAAAAVLVVVSGGLAWMIGQRNWGAPSRGANGPVAVAPGTGVTPGGAATPLPAPGTPDSSPVTPSSGAGPARRLSGSDAGVSPAAVADFGVARYDATINELQGALQASRSRLDPHTVQIVEQNLALIDKAIAEARAALAADPASPYLNAHLASTMRRKVALLKRVNSLAQI